MSGNSETLRDRLAAGHLARCRGLPKTVTVLDAADTTLWSGLYAIARSMSTKEYMRQIPGLMGVQIEKVFEIPRQPNNGGTFSGLTPGGVAVRPDTFKIQYGTQQFQVHMVSTDDLEVLSTDEEPSVWTCFCTRLGAGVGEMASR
jgi:hypothetical protein